MNEVSNLFWSQCWQLTAMILIAALLGATVFRQRPHLMHVLWVLVFVKSLTLPLWSSPTSVFSWLQPNQPMALESLGYLAPAPSPHAAAPLVQSPLHVAASEAAVTRWVPGFETGLTLALWVWAIGVIVLLALAVRRWVEIYRLLKTRSRTANQELETYAREVCAQLQMKSRVRVWISEANLGPMVFGSYRPILILPEVMTQAKTPRELRPIVAHELLHAKRGDTTFGVIQFVAQIVWWFHPLVWWASRQANRVCERCCDEEVVANLGCKPREYARCLLDALELRSRLSTVPALPGIRSVDITSNRVENIMKNADRFRRAAPRRYWIYAVVLALILLPGGGLVRAWQDTSEEAPAATSPTIQLQAEQAAASRDWAKAAEKFRALTEQNDSDGRAWFMLGYCLHADGKLDQAIVAHQRAAKFPAATPIAFYNLACAYALKSDRDAAIAALRRAIEAGYCSFTPLGDDPDFAALKEDTEFIKLSSAAKPLADREIYRQFDFFIGRWDVFDRDGQQVGINVITRGEKGFLLTSKWTSGHGHTGTSINYYDPSDQHWKQTRVDASGNVIQYKGLFTDGRMLLEGRLAKPNGVMLETRLSYSLEHDGSVRQLIEHSDDAGRTWRVFFDGRHVRHAVQNPDALPSGAS